MEWHKPVHSRHNSVKEQINPVEYEVAETAPILQEPIQVQTDEVIQYNEQTETETPVTNSNYASPSIATTHASIQSAKLPSDSLKKREKWVPYKYRKQQKEAENSQSSKSSNENEEPEKRSGFDIGITILGSILAIYFGYGGTILMTAFCLLIFDFTISLSLEAYFAAFLLAWIMFAGITSLLLRMWMQPHKDETYKAFKKRLWRYSMLIAVGLALITVIVLGTVMFL